MSFISDAAPEENYVIAIGASAGGLEAIHEFFDHMPADGPFSFVVIQHLSSNYKSLLTELVAKHTAMKVLEAEHNQKTEKGNVYIIPNNKILEIKGGKIQLLQKEVSKLPNTAVDTFLKSLAKDQQSRAIAVILSGTGTDGTRGIEAVQNEGGIVLVQEPESAKFNGMPNSAIAAGYADFILPPHKMPAAILSFVNEKKAGRLRYKAVNEGALPEIFSLLQEHCSYDFNNYKSPTIIRRITRRMNQLQKTKFEDYLTLLRQSSEECKILSKEFLIGVTQFFRDKDAFEMFDKKVAALVIKNKEQNACIKVWVAACSTGQEAYTIAILLNEAIKAADKKLDIKIFATDIDADAIEVASKGAYPLAIATEVPEELLKKYFTLQNDKYVIVPALRRQIVFTRHNILKDPPFSNNDIISCRNMLIYMNPVLQRKVFATFHYALQLEGFLFLGPSESPASIAGQLTSVDAKWKLYRKTGNDKIYTEDDVVTEFRYNATVDTISEKAAGHSQNLEDELKNVIVEELNFAAVSITKKFEIKEAAGNFRKYLQLPQNVTNINLLNMIDEALATTLKTGVEKAVAGQKKLTIRQAKLTVDGKEKAVDIIIKTSAVSPDWITLVFGERSIEPFYSRAVAATPSGETKPGYIAHLEEELSAAKHQLKLAVESLESSNEELQSSNEELLSSNEELQSSNEELQSLNEELHTLNTEHQHKIKELEELNDDLNNYFRSTDIGQIFVDKNLCIRKFNPAAVRLINLIQTDVGRRIEHIATNLASINLSEEIATALEHKKTVEKEVKLSDKTVSLMRIQPFVRHDGQYDGVIVSFFDISDLKGLNNIIKGVFDTSLNAIMVFKSSRDSEGMIADFNLQAANHASVLLLDNSGNKESHSSLKNDLTQLSVAGLYERFLVVVNNNKLLHTEVRLTVDGEQKWYEAIANKMEDGLVLTLVDINEKKTSEVTLKNNFHELIKVKESLYNLNFYLEQKIRNRTEELSNNEERFRLIVGATSDVVWDWDLVNNNIWWSDSFCKVFAYENEKEPSGAAAFWLNRIHPDDKQQVQTAFQQAINTAAHNWTAQYRFKKGDGSYAIVSHKGSVITDTSGIPYRMVGAIADITETAHTEAKLQEKNEALQALLQEFTFVTDFMPQIVFATRHDGYHEFFNKQWYDYTGLDFETTKDTGWSLVVHPDDKERTWNVWNHSLQSGELYEIEYRLRRYDGEYRWFLGRAIAFFNEDGVILKWFGTCTDIHDQKMMSDVLESRVAERTAELVQLNKELENSNAELMQFASVASHDLKEPLRKIHMFSTLINDRYSAESPQGLQTYLERISSSSARMTNLINDLLTYSRLSITDFFVPVDLNLILKEVLNDLELSIAEKKAVITSNALPQIDAVPGQWRQVFQNIISNALKFTKPELTPVISITGERVAALSMESQPLENGLFCRITIKDNGIGFDEQYAQKIFTIFQRLHSREKYEGTGIGLAITKKIIEKHNGIISAQSTEGAGATFIIILPVSQQQI